MHEIGIMEVGGFRIGHAQNRAAATGCDIIDHVKTQAPYCAAMAAISFVMYIVFGFVL